MGRLWSRLWNSPWPTLGCEISPGGISVARWSWESSRLETLAWKPLAAGAVEASPLRDNIERLEEVQQALASALASLGLSATPSAFPSDRSVDAVLVLPDQAARLFVLSFDAFPSRSAEALALVKWRLKKSVPFDIESAALSYLVQPQGSEWQVVAVAMPQTVIRQYEALAESFGLRPRWVTLSMLASLGLAPDSGPDGNGNLEDQGSKPAPGGRGSERPGAGAPGLLVAKYSPPWFTTAILQSRHLRLFRTVGIGIGENGLLSPADVLEAVYPSVAYFQDNFGGPLGKGYLCGLGNNSAAIAESLAQELNLQAKPLLPDLANLASGLDSHQMERHFAALWGIVRERQRG